MKLAQKTWRLAVLLALLVIVVTTLTVSGQQQTGGDPFNGGRLYVAWDLVLGKELPLESQPLWGFPDESTPTSWQCVNCHGWDYQGKQIRLYEGEVVGGELSADKQGGIEYPSLLSMFAEPEEEIIKWLDGTHSRDHDFSRYLPPEAISDISAFISAGLVAPGLIADPATGIVSGTAALGEDSYKQICRQCHGPEGAKINFGSVDQPWFLGNIAANNPWRVAHIVRFGHAGGEFGSTEKIGWSFNQQVDLLAYMQILPAAYLKENDPVEVIDFSEQGSTTPLVYAAAGLVAVILGGVGLAALRERRSGG